MLQRILMHSADADLSLPIVQQGMRLDTLLVLRWMMFVAQASSVLVVFYLLHWQFPVILSLIVLSVSLFSTLFIRHYYHAVRRLNPNVVMGFLIFDVVQFSALLYLTGGLENPFCFLLLIPVMVSATTLRQSHTVVLVLLVALVTILPLDAYTLLERQGGDAVFLDSNYKTAIWIALMTCLLFTAIYGFRIASESRSLSAALNATELVLAREQHLSTLDGMAAAAAHELGTPLSTIAVVVRELERETLENSSHKADIELLSAQVKRCREILGKLSSLGIEKQSPLLTIKLEEMLEEIADPHRNFGVEIDVVRHATIDKNASSPKLYRMPGVLYGLSNLVENAVDFARSCVQITLAWDEDAIIVSIEDDGPGFSSAVINRLGVPYITSRQGSLQTDKVTLEGGGMGLGIFIAKTLLERTGAEVTFANGANSLPGAKVTAVWRGNQIRLKSESG